MSLKPATLPPRFYAILLATGWLTFLFHELAHWSTGTMLGHSMLLELNQVQALDPMPPGHALLVDAAGPLVTVLQAIVGFAMLCRRSNLGFALLYNAFFMRLLATGVSAWHPNDEMRISTELGLGAWTLPVLVATGLLILVVAASRRLKLTLRDQLLAYAVTSVTVTTIVAVDQLMF